MTTALYTNKNDVIEWVKAKVFLPENYGVTTESTPTWWWDNWWESQWSWNWWKENLDSKIKQDMIINKIWGIDNEYESNNLEVYLTFIRRKLKLIESNVNIKVLRGIGYKLEVTNEKTKK